MEQHTILQVFNDQTLTLNTSVRAVACVRSVSNELMKTAMCSSTRKSLAKCTFRASAKPVTIISVCHNFERLY